MATSEREFRILGFVSIGCLVVVVLIGLGIRTIIPRIRFLFGVFNSHPSR